MRDAPRPLRLAAYAAIHLPRFAVATQGRKLRGFFRLDGAGVFAFGFGVAIDEFNHRQRSMIAVTEAGIAKGVTDADDAKLRLGIAYLGAGQRPKALETWKSITPGSVPAQLAALWRIQK